MCILMNLILRLTICFDVDQVGKLYWFAVTVNNYCFHIFKLFIKLRIFIKTNFSIVGQE